MEIKGEKMSVQLEKQDDGSICVFDMKDGQIGVLTHILSGDDKIFGNLCGLVVQRYSTILCVIGEKSEKSFPLAFFHRNKNFRVRLLRKGEKIIVTQN